MNHHQPLRVTASLEGGLATAGTWGIALDGLLASLLHAQAKASGDDISGPVLDDPDPADLDLPLARCHSDPWHWASTCAWPVDGADRMPEVRWWSAHTDHAALEQLVDRLPRNLRAREGRYRSRWMPLLITPCSAVVWHAVGDLTTIQQLLEPVIAIGKKRAAGHGRVLSWTITPAPELDVWTAAHLHPDGTLGRPTPPVCLASRPDLVDAGTGRAGIRPPYVHPARQHDLHLPT